jgi:simple sugar transport system ATP-binding protein
MNILFGMPVIHSTGGYAGEIILDGQTVNINTPEKAMELGIGMVHQEFMLIPGFTVAENIKLNREVTKGNPISQVFGKDYKTLDYKTMNRDAREALDKLEIGIDEYAKVEGLPVGYMQFIEIAREIDKKNIRLLVFDEPTAVLTESEADNLIKAMKHLAAQGIAIVFITHRLDEVTACSQHVVILRDGGLVAAKKTSDTNTLELAELMVGRKLRSLSKTKKIVMLKKVKPLSRCKTSKWVCQVKWLRGLISTLNVVKSSVSVDSLVKVKSVSQMV